MSPCPLWSCRFTQPLERLDRSHLEASLDLGAGQVRTFFLVIVPLTATGIVSGLIITFIPTLGLVFDPPTLPRRS